MGLPRWQRMITMVIITTVTAHRTCAVCQMCELCVFPLCKLHFNPKSEVPMLAPIWKGGNWDSWGWNSILKVRWGWNKNVRPGLVDAWGRLEPSRFQLCGLRSRTHASPGTVGSPRTPRVFWSILVPALRSQVPDTRQSRDSGVTQLQLKQWGQEFNESLLNGYLCKYWLSFFINVKNQWYIKNTTLSIMCVCTYICKYIYIYIPPCSF